MQKKSVFKVNTASENVKLIDESLLKKMIESEILDMNNPFRPNFV